MPLSGPFAAAFITVLISSMLVARFAWNVRSTSDTLIVGTRTEKPSSLPLSSGNTRPTAAAAPVLVGIMDCVAERARRRSLWNTSVSTWSFVYEWIVVMTSELDQLVGAWRRGDAKGMAKLLQEGFDEYPDLYRPLTVERNRRWVPQVEQLLDDQDDYLVVVGALHLVGTDSVIDLLERKGYKVEQL